MDGSRLELRKIKKYVSKKAKSTWVSWAALNNYGLVIIARGHTRTQL